MESLAIGDKRQSQSTAQVGELFDVNDFGIGIHIVPFLLMQRQVEKS